ncbi:DUF791-domain-containing protein [Fomitiporia mediterranea MF3/22]|uniref:Molybdate-anion transporter n=1 Tax=Fomitiporia mediterranea (strain MF3/22) TaxID=694068 RepID=R7SFZ4_FOMME|nr:DUF791-domain-containing protein [Fomitiporia mediterranea MF3/22]EJC97636.1 DUF791-domain-containing protein [Fomitiporia mediterranea MF3/22]
MPTYSFYETQLAVLAAFCILAVLFERRQAAKKNEKPGGHAKSLSQAANAAENGTTNGSLGWKRSSSASALSRQYLIVYGIVMCADWLQGPYVYSLYREQYDLPERIVASLFVTGFLSGGLTAPIVGAWADQHGRRRICQAFCVTYTLSCVAILFNSLPILYTGRILGGISTSILFSAFESWLVSSANNQGVEQSELSSIFGRATLVNGFVAFSAGIVSNKIVGTFETFAAPFIASGMLLVLGWVAIKSLWGENFGNGGGKEVYSDPFQLKRLGQAWSIVRNDPTLLTLGLTQTCFEGSMYLFVFAWVPALQESSRPDEVLPLGYIFSAYMVSMMLGSLFYTAAASLAITPSNSPNLKASSSGNDASDNSLTLHAKLSSLVCTLGAMALAVSVTTADVRYRFWAFCLFEACVGVYYPVQGMLRGSLISNDHRATLSSLFRVPLNVFVVTALMTGVSSARLYVFAGCAFVLATSAIMTGLVVVPRTENVPVTLRSA